MPLVRLVPSRAQPLVLLLPIGKAKGTGSASNRRAAPTASRMMRVTLVRWRACQSSFRGQVFLFCFVASKEWTRFLLAPWCRRILFVGRACVTVAGAIPPGPPPYRNVGCPQQDVRKCYERKATFIHSFSPVRERLGDQLLILLRPPRASRAYARKFY
ncbi:hypothetical protein F5888DRAFT_1642732 [Russula emetica]|nr:hypothetical protein F5888DRAFT_1642732 [Russula emetica]